MLPSLAVSEHWQWTGIAGHKMTNKSHPQKTCPMCRAAYEQETRTTILGLDRVSKMAPNGKQILKDVRLGMYRGAKIGESLSLQPSTLIYGNHALVTSMSCA